MHAALVASLGAVALSFAANPTFAGSGAPAVAAGGVHVRGPAAPAARLFRPHRGIRGGAFWPATGGFFYDPSYGEVPAEVAQAAPRDVRYTYTYDVPWDWAHRYPPNVVPSDRAYVSECPEQTVKVRGKGGSEQTVNIMRCY